MPNSYQIGAGTDFQTSSPMATPMALQQQDARERPVDTFLSTEDLGQI